MAKSRAFANDSKKRVKEAPKKQTETGQRAGSRSSSRSGTRSTSASGSRSRSSTPTKRRSTSSRGSVLDSPRKSSRSSSPRRSSPRRSSPRGSSSPKKSKGVDMKKLIAVLLQVLVVVLSVLAIFFAIYYFSPRYRLGLDIVPAMGGDRLYFARDLSCFTFFGFKPECSKFKYRWAEYGCSKRHNVILVGGVFAALGAAVAIVVLVLMLLAILGCCPLIFVAFILAIVAAVLLTGAWVIVLAVYLASMCEGEAEAEGETEAETEPEPGYRMKDYTILGPALSQKRGTPFTQH